MVSLANPTRFLSLVDRVVPWLTAVTLILLGIGLYLSFFVAPPDYQQGETVKIMFIHVPAAWLAMFGYMLIAVAALRQVNLAPPPARRQARHVRLHADRCRGARHADLAPSTGRRRRQDRGADRRHLHLHRARD